MTCRVLITAPDGMSVEARALLASASFVSERLVQSPSLPCASQQIRISDCPTKLRSSPLQLSDISSQTWWQTHRGHSCCSSKGDMRLASFSSPLRFAVETHLGSTFSRPWVWTTWLHRHAVWSRHIRRGATPWPADRPHWITHSL